MECKQRREISKIKSVDQHSAMVCYVNESFPKDNNDDAYTKMTTTPTALPMRMANNATRANHISIDDLTIDENAFLHLKLQRIAGGSVIEYPPTYSPCGE